MTDGGKYSAWIWSLLIHAAIAGGFVASLRFTLPPAPLPAGEVIEAETIDAEALRQREREKIEAARRAEEARLAEIRRQREAAERAAAEQRRREEQARQAELRRQEEVRRQTEAEARRKAEAEAARRAEEEARRQAEAERQRRAEEEARRKAEAERRQREAEAAARREREADLRAQLEAEEQRFAAIRSGKQAQWIGAIRNQVMRNWSQPPNLAERFNCEFRVRQIPGGEVVSVDNIRCDNEILRRSAEAAIWRASPFPAPPDPSLFEQYITVKFQPEG